MVLWARQALLWKEREQSYLDVGAREDPHPAMVLSFIPVLVDLLVDVHNVPLLQGELPVNTGLEHVSRCFKMGKMKTPVFSKRTL